MKVFITGGTGFIGSAIAGALRERGDQVVVLTRDAGRARGALPEGVEIVEGESALGGAWQQSLGGCDAVINLAGASLAGKRWNARYKQIMHDSRVETTRYVVEGIASLAAERRPKVLVSASGIGYYPFSEDLGAAVSGDWDDDDEIDESAPSSDSFLGRLSRNWEAEARRAEEFGLRVVVMRCAVVLGDRGALEAMETPFKLFVGGRIGSGRQWFCWLHLRDCVRAYLFAVDREDLSGPYNLTSPEPVRNRRFTKALGKAMNRPAWLPVPAFAVKAAVGEFSEELLQGRRVVPKRLLAAGFEFELPTIDEALTEIY